MDEWMHFRGSVKTVSWHRSWKVISHSNFPSILYSFVAIRQSFSLKRYANILFDLARIVANSTNLSSSFLLQWKLKPIEGSFTRAFQIVVLSRIQRCTSEDYVPSGEKCLSYIWTCGCSGGLVQWGWDHACRGSAAEAHKAAGQNEIILLTWGWTNDAYVWWY